MLSRVALLAKPCGWQSSNRPVPDPLNPVTPQPARPAADQPSLRLTPREQGYSVEQALWTLVGIGLLWWSWHLNNFTADAWTVPFMVLGNVWGVATVLVSWLPGGVRDDGRLVRLFLWGTAIVTVALFIVWGVALSEGLSGYGTDAIAFDQYAADLARQGMNPYVHSLARAYTLFHVRPIDFTYTITGAHVTALSYPALSFLVYVPMLALGWTMNLAPLVNVCAWGLTTALMFCLSPRPLRPVVLLFCGYGVFAIFGGGGVTDVLFMPLLTLAAYRWDRFGSGRWTYAGPLLFGLAMAVKQTAWPVLPFLLVALALDQSRRSGAAAGVRRAGRYLAVVVVGFAVPNLPYFIASPHAWIDGVLTPFKSLVPTGMGTVSLSIYLHMGGGSLLAFTLVTVLVYALALVAFAGTYPSLRGGVWLLPTVAFLFASRSNINYFAALIPAGYIAAMSSVPGPARVVASVPGVVEAGVRSRAAALGAVGRWFRAPGWAVGCGALALAALAALIYSLSAPAPLDLRLTSLQTAGRSDRVRQLTVRVANRSAGDVRPAFAMLRPGPNTSFWTVIAGPSRLAAGQVADYTLRAPGADSEPSIKGTFNVIGFVASPGSFSVSDEYDETLYIRSTRHRQRGSHDLLVRFS